MTRRPVTREPLIDQLHPVLEGFLMGLVVILAACIGRMV